MKKIMIIFISFLLVGCTNKPDTLTLDNALNNVVSQVNNNYNTHGMGFKYYKPRDFSLLSDNENNHVLLNNGDKYYLNVDLNGYYNKYSYNYVVDETLYYSKSLEYNGLNGFLEIKDGKNGYFYIKMMYNYSYVEVSVKEENISRAVMNSAIILSSIKYNDNVIDKLISSGDLDNKETTYELKKPVDGTNNDKNILDVYDYDKYTE